MGVNFIADGVASGAMSARGICICVGMGTGRQGPGLLILIERTSRPVELRQAQVYVAQRPGLLRGAYGTSERVRCWLYLYVHV